MYNTLKQRARSSVKSKKGACAAYALICMLIFPVVDFSAYYLSILFRRYSSFIIWGEYAALLIFSSAIALGGSLFFLELSKKNDVSFINFFDGFENLFKAIALAFVIALFTALWSVLLIVPRIIAFYSYRVSMYILAECPELAPLDALRISKNMMQGKKMRLFLLDISFIGWFLLTAATCGIAGIYVIPYYKATNTEFYREIKADYIDRQNNPTPDDIDDNKNTDRSDDAGGADGTGSHGSAFDDENNKKDIHYRSDEERKNHTWSNQ